MSNELIHLCAECRIEYYEIREIEMNVTILMELPLIGIIKTLTECKDGNEIKQILRQLTDCQPRVVLTNQHEWVLQNLVHPNDPVCGVLSYRTVATKEVSLFSNH